MGDLPDRARAVVIGAGIMGSALVHHLALQGWKDLVLIDQGPFPNTGGSTGHSSAMVWLPEANRLLTASTVDSVRQYRELGVHRTVGGLDLGRTPERIADYRRRIGFIRTWGDYEAELLGPAEVKALVPYLDESILLGGALPAADRRRGRDPRRDPDARSGRSPPGALQAFPLTEVTGLNVEDGRIAGVRTDRGPIRTDVVVICCGVWSPRLARMAGRESSRSRRASSSSSAWGRSPPSPTCRARSTSRSFATATRRSTRAAWAATWRWARPATGRCSGTPTTYRRSRRPRSTPTELPFTPDDFDASLESALELFPSLFEDERAGIRYAINGLVSISADGLPDPRRAARGARALVRQPGGHQDGAGGGPDARPPGWSTGMPETALQPFDIARFLHARADRRPRPGACRRSGGRRYYEPLHPAREFTSNRNLRLSPIHERLVALGGVLSEQAGWEVPKWYAANEPLLAGYGDRVLPRPHEWDARWWSPIVNAEHLAHAGRAGTSRTCRARPASRWPVPGPGLAGRPRGLGDPGSRCRAWRPGHRRRPDVAAGPGRRHRVGRRGPAPGGGPIPGHLVADREARDRQWLARHLPADGRVAIRDVSSAWCSSGVWGARRGLPAAAPRRPSATGSGPGRDPNRPAGRTRLGAPRSGRGGASTLGRALGGRRPPRGHRHGQWRERNHGEA